jgi:hypothetical protein
MPLAILVPVSEPKFTQPARRNLLAPVLVAFVILGIAIALVVRYTPHTIADLTILRTAVCPTHTLYKSDTMIVGRDQAQDDLYVLTTLRVEDRLNLPIFLKDFTATLLTADGEQLTTSAVEKQDLESLYTTFPALKPLASTPLLRETLINPGHSAEGMVLLHFPVTQEVWNRRRSAVLHIDLYHQGPISITIPQSNQISSSKNRPATELE